MRAPKDVATFVGVVIRGRLIALEECGEDREPVMANVVMIFSGR
jgi:hypothetical protein